MSADVQKAVTGQEARTALVAALVDRLDYTKEQAEKLQFYIDIGVIAVTVGAGGYKIAVDAKRLAKADETVAHLAGPFNPQKLNSKLLAEEVASGHAFQKHVIDGKEFQNLGIFTRQQFQEFVESIVSNPSVEVRYATN